MGIGHGRLLQVVVDAAAATLVTGFQFDRNPRAMIDLVPLDPMLLDVLAALVIGFDDDAFALAVEDFRAVALGVDLQLVVVRVGAFGDFRHDLHRLAGRQQAIHAGGADSDALLAAAHPHAVELRTVKELAENQGNLLPEDARAVVLHADLEAVVADAFDMYPDLRENASLFAGVEGVVDGLLDGRQQGFARIVEPQQMAILGKELADRDFFLTGGHRLRGRPATVGVDLAVALGGSVAVGLDQFIALGERSGIGHFRPVAYHGSLAE